MKPRYEKHVFVCVNERPPDSRKGCCAEKGGHDIRLAFVKLISEHGLKGNIRANKAGCLDACELGPTVVIYPDDIWYVGFTIEDVPEIFTKSVLNDGVAERLVASEESWEKLREIREREEA